MDKKKVKNNKNLFKQNKKGKFFKIALINFQFM